MSAKTLLATAENGAWRNIQGEWRQLFGSFSREGVSVEYHHFRSEKALDWSRSFHPGSLEICLNLQGTGSLRANQDEFAIGVRSVACYLPAVGGKFHAARTTGEHHHFVTVELSRDFLAARLGATAAALAAPVKAFLQGDTTAGTGYVMVESMNMAVQGIARSLEEPPVNAGTPAGRVWYEAKILELISLLLFAPVVAPKEEMFCDRQKRINRSGSSRCALCWRATWKIRRPWRCWRRRSAVGCFT